MTPHASRPSEQPRPNQARRDLIILLVAVVAFAGLSAGVILAMNRQPKVRDPLASAKLPVGEQPLALTIVHTNDAWGYLFGCG
jgi:hypothetical protein